SRHIDERWMVVDTRDRALFHVERYLAVDHPSYAVYAADGSPLGGYVGEGIVHHNATVREGASAPVASMAVHHHEHVIRELDGPELGSCRRTFSAAGNDDEDEIWVLHIDRLPDL